MVDQRGKRTADDSVVMMEQPVVGQRVVKRGMLKAEVKDDLLAGQKVEKRG